MTCEMKVHVCVIMCDVRVHKHIMICSLRVYGHIMMYGIGVYEYNMICNAYIFYECSVGEHIDVIMYNVRVHIYVTMSGMRCMYIL